MLLDRSQPSLAILFQDYCGITPGRAQLKAQALRRIHADDLGGAAKKRLLQDALIRSGMNHLDRYRRSGYKQVHGWLEPFSARYSVNLLDCSASPEFLARPKIGVHHGRLFILLHLGGSGRTDLAIDVFDDQHLNADRSGHGDRRRFIANVIRWGGSPAAIDIPQKSSLNVF